MGQVQNISHQTHRERQSALPVPKRSTLGEMGRKQNKRKRILCRSHLLVVGARVDQGSAVDTWRPWICFSELHPFPRGRRGKLGAAGGAGGGAGGKCSSREGWQPAGQEFEITAVDSRAGARRARAQQPRLSGCCPGEKRGSMCLPFSDCCPQGWCVHPGNRAGKPSAHQVLPAPCLHFTCETPMDKLPALTNRSFISLSWCTLLLKHPQWLQLPAESSPIALAWSSTAAIFNLYHLMPHMN